jgi:hypothetical protein
MASTATGDFDDENAFSPASSVASSASAMSLSSDASPVPSPTDSTASELAQETCLPPSPSTTTTYFPPRPSSPSTTMTTYFPPPPRPPSISECHSNKRKLNDNDETNEGDKRRRVAEGGIPKTTHKPEYNEQLQGQEQYIHAQRHSHHLI